LVGYLYFVQTTGAESTNCQLAAPTKRTFTSGLASTARLPRAYETPHAQRHRKEAPAADQHGVEITRTTGPVQTDMTYTFSGNTLPPGQSGGQLMLDNDHTVRATIAPTPMRTPSAAADDRVEIIR